MLHASNLLVIQNATGLAILEFRDQEGSQTFIK